jgi:hypothetical protein
MRSLGPTRRRWYQFGLGTMFVLVTVAALAIVTFSWLRHYPLRRIENAAIAEYMQRTSLPQSAIRAHAMKDGQKYHVVVWYVPETPGGQAYLTYSSDGTLEDIELGE